MSDDIEINEIENDTRMTTIDYDDILRLRRQGMWDEAEELLLAFRNNCGKQKYQDKKELIRTERKIKKVKGICVAEGCEERAEEDRTLCERHKILNNARIRKHYGLNCKWKGCKEERKYKCSYCEFHLKVTNTVKYKISDLTPKQLRLRRALYRQKYYEGKK